jgi:PAS domain S-box-containing protein
MKNAIPQSIAKGLAVSLAYCLAGKLGLLLAVPPGYATAIFPSSGIALTALLFLGYRFWPAVWLGSFLLNVPLDVPFTLQALVVPACIGAGASLQALAGVFLIQRRVVFPSPLDNTKDILWFFLFGGPASCIISPTVGVGTLLLMGIVPPAIFRINWLTWWIGDSLGAIVVTPLLLAYFGRPAPSWRQDASVTGQEHRTAQLVIERTNELNAAYRALNEAQRIALLGSWELDPVSDKLFWSDEIYRIFELDQEHFGASYEAFLSAIHPEDREMVNTAYTNSLATRVPYDITHRLLMPDGRIKYVHEQCETVFDESGKALRSMGTVQDITERKRAAERIERSLAEKEVLLKEIHHRVKNNMQVVSSLLMLQSRHIKDDTIRAIFNESRSRIHSMSLIHEKLYGSEDLAHIDFSEYVGVLVKELGSIYNRPDVAFSVDMPGIFLDINTGIPCGLIINELVSNSLKHAFPEGGKGKIIVGLRDDREGRYVLTVEDDGAGFPADLDFRDTSSLGMQLVTTLTTQIKGTIELSTGHGTTFTITFPIPQDKGV